MPPVVTPIALVLAFLAAGYALFLMRTYLRSMSQSLLILDTLARNRQFPLCLGVDLFSADRMRAVGGSRAIRIEQKDPLHRVCRFAFTDKTELAKIVAWPGTQITCVRINGSDLGRYFYPTTQLDLTREEATGAYEIFVEPV